MIEQFQKFGIEIKPRPNEQKTKCPQCHHKRKNKSDNSLSVNVEKGVFNCHNCGWSGTVVLEQKTEYIKPKSIKSGLEPKIINWFEGRGISESTLVNWKVTSSVEYFPQIQGNATAINFNYFRDGELINIKYRDSQKNFRMVKDAELIFYGLDRIKEMDKIYIVEGEIDALSFHEAGIYSVCSVPNGASKGNQRLEYLDNCWEYFKDKKEIIICTDNDDPGIALRNELARRFGFYRCKFVDFGVFKDANEVLKTEGGETLKNILKGVKSFPLEGILDINDIWDKVLSYNEKGFKNYSIGLGDSDEYLRIQMGEWSVITGIPNSGKSDVLDQICVNLARIYGFRIGMFAPESFPYEGHIKRLADKINEKKCNNNDLENTKYHIQNHFYFVKIDLDNITLESILDKFRELVFQKGINIAVIDPWNMLDLSSQTDHAAVGRTLSKITHFCQQTNIHLFLVAHPKKMQKDANGQFEVPNAYSISGSSDFFNKAYNCVTVYRNRQFRSAYESDRVDIHVQKVKRKENGQQGEFSVAPDFKNGGVYRDGEFQRDITNIVSTEF